tara:strand:+ start:96 stop:227 length:132 start_codon:yes stop_codon:yes gene_type:complete
MAMFSFVEQPDRVGAPERIKRLYGWVMPIHLERARFCGDSFIE